VIDRPVLGTWINEARVHLPRVAQPGRLDPEPVVVPGSDRASPTAIPPDIVALVEQGRKIEAIKRYRQLNEGVGLKEAKDVIDTIVINHAHSQGTRSRSWTPYLGYWLRPRSNQWGDAGGDA
jgi:hypothetical protein